MGWDFETEPAFQAKLDWITTFVREEVDPLEFVLGNHYDVKHPDNVRLIRPLQQQVKAQGLWACHLGKELGGQGYGQVQLALMNEILGAARFGPIVFGCQAPDTGNAEILAHFGTSDQKARYLQPLLNNHIVSCFSMTEPQGGADPLEIRTRAVLEGDHWVIDGEKWFASNASLAEFLIVMAQSEPDAAPHQRISAFIVPAETPGIEIVRDCGYGTGAKTHAYVRFHQVRVPADHILGQRGQGFLVAQTRLGGGRIHHAMRTIAKAKKALDYMVRRSVSRSTKGSLLSQKQMVQERIADAWIQLEQFRLLVMRTAWLIDKHQDYRMVRKDIAAVKAAMPKVLHDIASHALQVHGSLGLSDEMPFMHWVTESYFLGLADGPTEVHKVTVAQQLTRHVVPDDSPFPDYHLPQRAQAARDRYAGMLEADLP
ncbi:acyl-CoA dehydrogenase family protein [Acidovorax soli]|uniref:acyl-CoA dehydrogenase family protein n=1 Tax=Acidovorax soli TaxID=592050 RepID=UPI0032B2346E